MDTQSVMENGLILAAASADTGLIDGHAQALTDEAIRRRAASADTGLIDG